MNKDFIINKNYIRQKKLKPYQNKFFLNITLAQI